VPLFETGIGLELMRTESDILIDVLNSCAIRDMPALPVHDAVVVREDHAADVEELMRAWFLGHARVPVEVTTHRQQRASSRPTSTKEGDPVTREPRYSDYVSISPKDTITTPLGELPAGYMRRQLVSQSTGLPFEAIETPAGNSVAQCSGCLPWLPVYDFRPTRGGLRGTVCKRCPRPRWRPRKPKRAN